MVAMLDLVSLVLVDVVVGCVTYIGGLETGRFDGLYDSLSHIGFDD